MEDTSRFKSLISLYGEEVFAKFQQAHVTIVGLGGVGSWVAEALARSGIGRLTLIDGDDVCQTNINRQILALESTVGKAKVEVMKERIREINPACQVEAIQAFVLAKEPMKWLGDHTQTVVDAIDSVKPKCALIAACRERGVKVFVSGGSGGITDPAKIQVSDLSKAHNDPLLSSTRRTLRKEYGFQKDPKRKMALTAVWSSEQRPKVTGKGNMDCAGSLGSSVAVTSVYGMQLAAMVMESIKAS